MKNINHDEKTAVLLEKVVDVSTKARHLFGEKIFMMSSLFLAVQMLYAKPIIESVTLSSYEISAGESVTVTIIAQSEAPVDWINRSLYSPKGNMYGGGHGCNWTYLGNDRWQYEWTDKISAYMPGGKYYYSRISCENEAQDRSDDWSVIEFTVINDKSYGPPTIESVTLSSSTIVAGESVTVTIIAQSEAPVDWISRSLYSPKGNMYGGGHSCTWIDIGNGRWKYEWTDNFATDAPDGVYRYSRISCRNAARETSEAWSDIEFSVANINVYGPPKIESVTLSSDAINAGDSITVTVIAQSAAVVNWINQSLYSPKGNMYGGGHSCTWEYLGDGKWKYSWTDHFSEYTPEGIYYYSWISCENAAEERSENWEDIYFVVGAKDFKVVCFDPGFGGRITRKIVGAGEAVGTLPDVTRDGFDFNGWFTSASGGAQVTAATVVTDDVTYYAQWTKNSEPTPEEVTLGDWYEAHDPEEICMCMRWEDFAMGSYVAVPVVGLASPLDPADVILTAGSYSEFGTPQVLSESDMWSRYGAPVQDQVDSGNVVYEEYDNVWANWDSEDEGAYGYELSADIWPGWEQVEGRQWILIPTGEPKPGTHTFSLSLAGVVHAPYEIEFWDVFPEFEIDDDGVLLSVELNGVDRVVIPDGVTSIGSYAFYNCSSLESITLPNSVTGIGDAAFHGCSSLESLVIPDGCEVNEWDFYGCESLKFLSLPRECYGKFSIDNLISYYDVSEDIDVEFRMFPGEYKAVSNLKMGRIYCGGWWPCAPGVMEYDIWESNRAGLYGDEYAFIPVTGSGNISPVIFYGDTPTSFLGTPQVWTDQQLFEKFTPPGVDPVRWETEDEYDDSWEFCTESFDYEWPKSLWPDKRVVEGRRWIVVPVNKSSYTGPNTTFRVGIVGTSEISDPVVCKPGDNIITGCFPNDIFRGMSISGVEYLDIYDSDSTWWDEESDVGSERYAFENWTQYDSGDGMSFTVMLPSDGNLVIVGKEDDEDNLAQKEVHSVRSDNAAVVEDRESVSEVNWATVYTRRISVSKATTLTFRNIQDDCDAEFISMRFYPATKRSVFFDVGYTENESVGGVYSYWEDRLCQGYVTGGGVYSEGEKVQLNAIAEQGEAFSHWECDAISLTEAQKTSPSLSFTVTASMCGTMEDEARIYIRAVWKPKQRIVALPSIVGAGTVTGSGRYYAGTLISLSATANAGYRFCGWSDGVSSALRSYTVPDDENRRTLVYAFFRADGASAVKNVTFDADGGEVAETLRMVTSGTTLGELPVPKKEGYAFAGWYTAKTGGTLVTGSTLVDKDMTLYARWRETEYSIRFFKNDASSTVSVTRRFNYGVNTALPSVKSLDWSRRGLMFKGWATSLENAAKGKIWKRDAAIVSAPVAAGNTLSVYAVWAPSADSYEICFHKNDGSGAWRTVGFTHGITTALPSVAGGLGWTRPGYGFIGWATSAANAAAGKVWKGDRAAVSAAAGAGKTLNVYAVWEDAYTIRFVRNEGSGYIFDQKIASGVKTRLKSLNALGWARRGFTFKGWATSTANARNGKIWKRDWAYVTSAIAAGKTLTIYAVWEISSGSYAIRFNKNDGSGAWRSVGYKYGVKTRMPSLANGLGWSRPGYAFLGWATSAANAASGKIWKGDWAYVATGIPEGTEKNVYAVWRKTSAAEYAISSGVSVAATRAPEEDVLLPGYYSGLLADGTGTYDLLVDEDGETGYVHILFDDGSVVSGEVNVDIIGDIILVVNKNGELCQLRYNKVCVDDVIVQDCLLEVDD